MIKKFVIFYQKENYIAFKYHYFSIKYYKAIANYYFLYFKHYEGYFTENQLEEMRDKYEKTCELYSIIKQHE